MSSTGFTHESANAQTVEWYTPRPIFKALGLKFDLDPCHPSGERLPWVPAQNVYTREDDGLSLLWAGRVWCNPPYGRAISKWLARMAAHRNGIALVFSRTDTGWFHRYCTTADAVLFLEGRVKFVDRTGEPPIRADGKRADAPPCGSMLLAWGEESVAALHRSGLGAVYTPALPAAGHKIVQIHASAHTTIEEDLTA